MTSSASPIFSARIVPISLLSLRLRSSTKRKRSRSFRGSAGRDEYRQLVLKVLNAPYVFQYRFDGSRLVMLRVFHGREQRGRGMAPIPGAWECDTVPA